MKKILISGFAASVLFLTQSCENDFETDVSEIAVSSGSADFSNYVALGNSLTAGFRDNALYIDGQMESYPNIMAQQMKLAGGGAFTQPLMPNNVGGFTNFPGFNGKLTLQVVNGNLLPVPSAPAAALDNISIPESYNNLGIPGAKSFHLGVQGYGNLNPYYTRFATSSSATVIGDAINQQPTFFSLWIGNNDVLSYATSGGIGINQTGNTNPLTYGSNDITDPNVLAASISGYVDALTANGAKGVIANIPNITSIPFFTRISYNPLTPTLLGGNVSTLNANLYGPLKQALTAFGAGDRINLLSETSANPVLIKDLSLTNLSAQLTAALTPTLGAPTAAAFGQIYGQARQTTSDDFVLLSTSSVIGSTNTSAPPAINVYGVSYPLENNHILTQTEANAVLTATAAYNTAIKSIADSKGLAFFNANAKMDELNSKSGILWNGTKYSATFVTGGAFSLDGIHLTGRGYAIVANEFIKAINNTYGSTLPQVNINVYSGVQFP